MAVQVTGTTWIVPPPGSVTMRPEDRADFEWLFRAAFPGIHRTLTQMMRDPARAEEVTQDAFVRLLEHWPEVSSYQQPEAWVRRVAIRMAVRQVRRESGRAPREQAAAAAPSPPVVEPDLDLADAVASLTPRQRAAVVLHYYEDLPVHEVARVLAVSESTVKQHLFRARAHLVEQLAGGEWPGSQSPARASSTARPASSRATGTRNGEQET